MRSVSNRHFTKLTINLGQAPVHQLNSDSYVGVQNSGTDTTVNQDPTIKRPIGSSRPLNQVFSDVNNPRPVVDRQQNSMSRPRLSGAAITKIPGAPSVAYRKGGESATESHLSRAKVLSPVDTKFNDRLETSKDGFSLRGHLEQLEDAIVEMVSELKYHRQQVGIISAEKDTSAAVAELNILQAKNAVLNCEYKLEQEIKRAEN